jgi:hypothetical protein
MALIGTDKNFSPLHYASIIPFENPADAAHFEEGVRMAMGSL